MPFSVGLKTAECAQVGPLLGPNVGYLEIGPGPEKKKHLGLDLESGVWVNAYRLQ